MITIHHLINSRSQRVIWLLEELELKYEIIFHERDLKTRLANKTLSDIHPLGKAPVLTDGQIVIAETSAIVEYLLENYGNGKLVPRVGSIERVQYIYWKNFAEASLMPYLAMKQLFARVYQRSSWFARPIIYLVSRQVNKLYLNPNLSQEVNAIEDQLSKNEWLSGKDFSAADLLAGFMLDALSNRFANRDKFPGIARFVDSIKQRPAYIRAQQKGKWSNTEFDTYWSHLKN